MLTACHAAIPRDLLPRNIENPAKGRPVANRPVHRRGPQVESALDFIEQTQGIVRRPIKLVDERENREIVGAAHLKELARLRLDAFGRVKHHHSAVNGSERTVGVFAEILVTRCVEQIK